MGASAASGDRLRRPDGRPARIALLLYGSPDHDSRVLKSAAALRDSGADVLIVGRSVIHSGAPEGYSRIGSDLPVYRTQDLDLTRTLPGLTRVWRQVRRRGPATAAAPPVVTEGAAHPTSPTVAPPSSADMPATRSGGGVRARLADVYMRGYDVVRLVRYWAEAVRVAARFRPDVVHANDGNTLPPALVLRRLRGSRIVYDSHELWTERNVLRHRWLAPHVEAVIERVGIRRAAAVITVSDSIAAWLQRHHRLRRRPVVVRNIPLRDGPVPEPAQGRLRELAGLGADEQVIAYCGGLTSGRGIEETIAALPRLPERMHLVLLGAGNPGYVGSLLAWARDLGVVERVHLAGRVASDEVAAALADADVSVVLVRPVCLSYTYALPNKLFESIHAGVPVVAGELPDIAAVVRSTGVGELFPVDDTAALAAAIRDVVADPAPYRAAARRAAETLDWRHEADVLVGAHRAAVRGFPA